MTAVCDDHDLVERAKTDPEAFGLLYERYVDQIYNYVFFRVGQNQTEAEDITAKVFHNALNHIGKYKHRGRPFSAWLYRIAHNLIANWHRDQKKLDNIPLDNVELPDVATDQPFNRAAKTEQMTLLMAAIQKLPTIRQQLLILKFVNGESNAAIGRILNRSEGAVKSLYHRTLLTLKDILADHPEVFDPVETPHDH